MHVCVHVCMCVYMCVDVYICTYYTMSAAALSTTDVVPLSVYTVMGYTLLLSYAIPVIQKILATKKVCHTPVMSLYSLQCPLTLLPCCAGLLLLHGCLWDQSAGIGSFKGAMPANSTGVEGTGVQYCIRSNSPEWLGNSDMIEVHSH